MNDKRSVFESDEIAPALASSALQIFRSVGVDWLVRLSTPLLAELAGVGPVMVVRDGGGGRLQI